MSPQERVVEMEAVTTYKVMIVLNNRLYSNPILSSDDHSVSTVQHISAGISNPNLSFPITLSISAFTRPEPGRRMYLKQKLTRQLRVHSRH
jgi:hypothetical protein